MRPPSTFCIPALLLLCSLSMAGCSRDAPLKVAQPADEPAAAAREQVASPPPAPPEAAELPEILVFNSMEEQIAFLESVNWWGEENRDRDMKVPHLILTGIDPAWRTNSQKLTVQQKKELFYRVMLPLVMHANGMVLEFREGLLRAQQELAANGAVSPESLALLQRLEILLPDTESQYPEALSGNAAQLGDMIEALLYRVDIVPPGLALGQAAYESGYGTSRFATEGNSLFGQWTYKGDGIVPGKQRKNLGNPQIKAFDFPFDSVRGYFINLMSHPAYEDFRRLRFEIRSAGKPLDSLVLADGLLKYSERGQEYVDSLKGMIRANRLDMADSAVFRDEPLRFMLNEQTAEAAESRATKIEQMRANGELQEIYDNMRLD